MKTICLAVLIAYLGWSALLTALAMPRVVRQIRAEEGQVRWVVLAVTTVFVILTAPVVVALRRARPRLAPHKRSGPEQ